MSDTESQQARLGAAATPIPAESGSWEEENAPQPSKRIHDVAAQHQGHPKTLTLVKPSVFLHILNGRIGFSVLSRFSFSSKLPPIFGRRVLF